MLLPQIPITFQNKIKIYKYSTHENFSFCQNMSCEFHACASRSLGYQLWYLHFFLRFISAMFVIQYIAVNGALIYIYPAIHSK